MHTCLILSKVYNCMQKGWPSSVDAQFQPYFTRKEELTGCVLWGSRVIIPTKLHKKLLSELHRDHPGITKMKAVACSYFWWPNLDKKIEVLVKSCEKCQAVKYAPPVAPLYPWVWPAKRWKHAYIDFAGPFQGAMFFVAVDAHSKWPEAYIMYITMVPKTIEVEPLLFSVYGLPAQIVSDNRPKFVSNETATFRK